MNVVASRLPEWARELLRRLRDSAYKLAYYGRGRLCPVCGKSARRFSHYHVAPEPCLESRLRERLGDDYLTADLLSRRAMVRMDITDIQYADQSFDVNYCSHVPDDRRAMGELCRVLKEDGWAILVVPITSDQTYEDWSIVDPSERLRAFGQEDHVRRYGPDYVERLRDAGFTVEVFKASDLVAKSDRLMMGLTSASGEIFFCRKNGLEGCSTDLTGTRP